MEPREILRRFVRRHGVVVLVIALAGAATAFAMRPTTALYAASTRLVLDTPDPQSSLQSQAIADTARAIVTSPNLVASAMREAGVSGDPREIAKNDLSLTALGSSGVLDLTVTNPSPQAAARLANALSTDLIQARLDTSQGRMTQIVTDLSRQIADLGKQIADAQNQVNELTAKAAGASGQAAATLNAQRQQAASERDFLIQRQSSLSAERDQLVAADALRLRPSVISEATPPRTPIPVNTLPRLTLGLLLGLIAGIAVAAVREAVRPSRLTAGPGGAARAADVPQISAPVLGDVPHTLKDWDPIDQALLASHVRRAADRGSVVIVELLALNGFREVPQLAEILQNATVPTRASDRRALARPSGERDTEPDAPAGGAGSRAAEAGTAMHPRRSPTIRPFNADEVLSGKIDDSGLILIVPPNLTDSDLEPVEKLVALTGWPLLGVINHRTRRQRQARLPGLPRKSSG